MELFRNIRLKKGKAILRKKIRNLKRVKFKGSLDSVKDIGIVWDASGIQDLSFLSKFQQKMQERNIDVKIIGYYPGEELPDRLLAIRYLSCFKRKDLNFFYIPVSAEAEKFIKTPFDVLIDVNLNNLLPLEYITALSVASLKVGLFNENNSISYFELMIEAGKKPVLNDYLDNVIYYLEMINKPAEINHP